MDQTLPIMTREIARRLEELDASLDPAAPDAGGLRLQAERFTDLMIDALFPRFAFDRTSRESRLLQAAGVLEDCLSHIPSSPPLESVFSSLLEHLPEVRRQLQTDLVAAYQGDPAAKSVDEVVLCYPAFKAISTYRLAHVLYVDGVPLLPRMMTEYAHRLTGIDIHPGARIGDSFFIDHGTGVVIGETTTIGCNVKLYQHVTLGAKSFEVGEDGTLVKDRKRLHHRRQRMADPFGSRRENGPVPDRRDRHDPDEGTQDRTGPGLLHAVKKHLPESLLESGRCFFSPAGVRSLPLFGRACPDT